MGIQKVPVLPLQHGGAWPLVGMDGEHTGSDGSVLGAGGHTDEHRVAHGSLGHQSLQGGKVEQQPRRGATDTGSKGTADSSTLPGMFFLVEDF